MKFIILTLLILYINVNLIYSTEISIRYVNKSSCLYHDKSERLNQMFTYKMQNLKDRFQDRIQYYNDKIDELKYDEAEKSNDYEDQIRVLNDELERKEQIFTNKMQNLKKILKDRIQYHKDQINEDNFKINFILELAYAFSILIVFNILDLEISTMIILNMITMTSFFGYMEMYKRFLFRIAYCINCYLLIRLEYYNKQEVTVAERIDENINQPTQEDEIIFVPLVTEVSL